MERLKKNHANILSLRFDGYDFTNTFEITSQLGLERQTTACPNALRTSETPAATVLAAPSGANSGFTSTCKREDKEVSLRNKRKQSKKYRDYLPAPLLLDCRSHVHACQYIFPVPRSIPPARKCPCWVLH